MKILQNFEAFSEYMNFNKDKSVGYHAQKRPKICICCRVTEVKFYLYHSTEIAKTRPGFDYQPEYHSVQINSTSP